MKKTPTLLGILISGRGSNMQAIARACESGDLPATVAVVISNRADAAGISWGRSRDIPCRVVPQAQYASREAHDRAIVAELRNAGVEWVCLAGYMRLLSPYFVEQYQHRLLNIHPSLLPSFPGLNAQEQAHSHGVRWTGCTVHIVDTELDHGPIVEQTAVPVLAADTVEDLEHRILEQEHKTTFGRSTTFFDGRGRSTAVGCSGTSEAHPGVRACPVGSMRKMSGLAGSCVDCLNHANIRSKRQQLRTSREKSKKIAKKGLTVARSFRIFALPYGNVGEGEGPAEDRKRP